MFFSSGRRGSFGCPCSDIGVATAGAVIQPLRKYRVFRALSTMRCIIPGHTSDSFAGPPNLVAAFAPPDAEQEMPSLAVRISLGLNVRETDLPPHPCAHPDTDRQKRRKIEREL